MILDVDQLRDFILIFYLCLINRTDIVLKIDTDNENNTILSLTSLSQFRLKSSIILFLMNFITRY